MTDRTISLRQLMTVLFLALFPLGTGAAARDACPQWARGSGCVPLAGGIAVALVALLGRSPVLGQGDLGAADCPEMGTEDGTGSGGPLSPLGSLPDRCPRGPDWQPPVRFSPGLPHPDYRRGAASGRMDGLWGAARLCPGL